MSLSIRTNVASLTAQNNLANTQSTLAASMNHLSSGERITNAGDDAAGLGISVSLEAQVSSYNQAARNANDGISVAQTAEGSLNEVSNILSRLRELTMQASSDGVGTAATDAGRAAIITEATSLTSELNRINTNTEYNGTTLFGAGVAMAFQVGIRNSDTITVSTAGMAVDATTLAVDVGGGLALDTSANASASLANIDAAIKTVSGYRASLGAQGNQLQSAVATIQTASQNLSSADSRIRDVDVANETSQLSRAQVLSQAGIAVLAQANQMPQMALKLLG
jgi:flagellin